MTRAIDKKLSFLLVGLTLSILLNAKDCVVWGFNQDPSSPSTVLLVLEPAINVSNSIPHVSTRYQQSREGLENIFQQLDTEVQTPHLVTDRANIFYAHDSNDAIQPNESSITPGDATSIAYSPEAAIALPVSPMEYNPSSSNGFYNMFDHSKPSRFWVSAQNNTVFQYHPSFHSPYSGQNSFLATPEKKTSSISSLFLGYQFMPRLEGFLCVERFDGRGLSGGFGLGGFVNMDVMRNPALAGKFYIARVGLHAVIPLSKNTIEADRTPFNFSNNLPARRIEIRVGKFCAADFFNYNSVGSDGHKQFLNWTIDGDGSYDYPADTRGYTVGAMLEYQSPRWAARFLEAAMPTIANGIRLDWNPSTTHSETYELEHRHMLKGRPGVVRIMSFVNHAHLGDYRQAIANFTLGQTSVPDITSAERNGTVKYGCGFNFEQEVLDGVTMFSRLGWNEGHHETFTYTDVDNTMVLGAAVWGKRWNRPDDKVGLALVSNGLSYDHRTYLALGGLGLLIGDGGLNYQRENLLETYYTYHVWKGIYVTPNIQFIKNPGYNHDRGPVLVASFRLHTDF